MSKQPFYMIQARAIFELILHRLLRRNQRHTITVMDLRIKKLLAFMDDHYAEELTINDFAEQLNLHPVYLGKLFKLNTGINYKEYLQRLRIDHAESILSTGKYTVTETAERCGYQDLSYFSKVFKELKGYSPSAAKKMKL